MIVFVIILTFQVYFLAAIWLFLNIDIVISPVAVDEVIPHHYTADSNSQSYVVTDKFMALGGSGESCKKLIASWLAEL